MISLHLSGMPEKEKPPMKGGCIFGGANRTRTYDPIDVNDVLYQLSHGTMRRLRRCI